MKKKLLFIIQRYGKEVNGGAEDYVRQYANHLLPYYDIDVYTSTAKNYDTWKKYYHSGKTNLDGVNVYYFNSPKRKVIRQSISMSLLEKNNNRQNGFKFLKRQGPYIKQINRKIKKNYDKYQAILCFCYLYYPTYASIILAKEKGILIPFLHEEPYAHYQIMQDEFKYAKRIIYQTEEEKQTAISIFKENATNKDNIILGIGIEEERKTSDQILKKYHLENQKYLIYIGRIDASKGVKDLIDNFLYYKRINKDKEYKLVLVGGLYLDIPTNEDIIATGFINEDEKYTLLKHADILINPSKYESLSIVILEAFAYQKPVLVNEESAVLKGQVERSNAGLYYQGRNEFVKMLQFLITNHDIRNQMGKNGLDFVNRNYRWDIVIKKLRNFIEKEQDYE